MSAYYVGRRGSLGIGKEAAGYRGTPVAPTYWIPYNSISFDEKAVVVDQESAMARIEDIDSSYVTKVFSEGEFEYDLEDKAIGLILAGVTGATPSSLGPTNFTHTYTLANTNQHQSLSLLVQDPNQTKNFGLCMIDKFTITVEPEGLVKCTVGWRGARGREWTAETTSYTALGNKFIHSMLTFKIATNIAGLVEASAINLKSLEWTVSKNIEDWQDLGTGTPSDILNKQLTVEGNFEIGFNDNTYRNYMIDGTKKSIEIMFTYGTNNSLQIQMPKVRFANWEPSKGLNDIATEKIEFKAGYDAANALAGISTLVLKNQVDSY